MSKGRYFPLLFVTLIAVFFALSWGVAAQDDEQQEPCPTIVQTAIASMGENCSVLDRNSACYGFNQVDSTFTEEVGDDVFNEPADTAELITLQTIQTSPLDIEAERWGVAVLNVQANVPGILPGQAVTFMLVGDTTVENAVEATEVTADLEPFTITVNARANVRSGDSTNTNVIGVADPGTELTADAVNEARTWVRVTYGGRIAWVSLEVIDEIPNLEELPIVEAEVLSPMQAFYFQTSIGQPACADAPDVLAIRSPENIVVDLSVNGANIQIGSLIVLKQIDTNLFLIYVEDGHVDTEDGETAETGQTIIGELDEDGNWIRWIEVRDATEEEEGWGDLFVDGYTELGLIEETPTFVGGNCGTFNSTSPTLGLGYGQNTFFWDPYQGATTYRLVVNNLTGGSFSFDTTGPQTNITVNLTNETVGGGYDFAWYVQALVNGRVVCTSRTITLQRGAEQVTGGPAFWASWVCGPPVTYSIDFSWGNLPAGQTVTFNFTENAAPMSFGPFNAPSGTQNYYTGALPISAASATTSGGAMYPLPGVLTCF